MPPNKATEVVRIRQEWEYHVTRCFVGPDYPDRPVTIALMLANCGEENWELVQIIPDHANRVDAGTGLTYFFKRPKEEA